MAVTVSRIIIALTLAFFAVGAVLAYFGQFNAETYIVVTGIVGSVASVIGLVALGAARLTADDVRSVEADLLKGIAEQVQAAKEYEEKLATNREEISRLERERVEIELIVRQASLKLFMEERLRYIAMEIEKRIAADVALENLLSNYNESLARVKELDGQITVSDRADTVRKILGEVRGDSLRALVPRREFYVTLLGNKINIYPFLEQLGKLGKAYIGLLQKFP
jgi:hypothetical protein